MTVKIYQGRESQTTHEMRARQQLIESLQCAFAGPDESVTAVFDFSCGADIDLALFKRNAIVVVELKECDKPITGGENGQWLIADNKERPSTLKGGNKDNPFQQVKDYRFALMRYLDERRGKFLSPQKASLAKFGHIAAAVVLSPNLHPNSHLDFDFGRLPWFRVLGLPDLPKRLQAIRSKEINLSEHEIECLVRDVLRCTPLEQESNMQLPAAEAVQPLNQPAVLTSKKYAIRWRFNSSAPESGEQPPDYHKDLNSQQRAAVEYTGSHLLILAGAGTGKTKVLTYRAAHLLKKCHPSQMLLMTFTNKAADEMYQRIRTIRPLDASQMWVGTFHRICHRILIEHATKLGYTSNFTILDAADSKAIMNRCAPRGAYVNTKEVFDLYSYSRNAREPWQVVREIPAFRNIDAQQDVLAGMLASYERRLKRNDRMDFDGLLTNTVLLLEGYPEVRQAYRQQFRYILVDEYQDTCKVQAYILRLLASNDNVTVVGDDSQAIYGFRAASVKHIFDFKNDFRDAAGEEAKVRKLEENYRSTPHILNIANAALEKNRTIERKRLFSSGDRSEGELPWYCQCKDQRTEAEFVVSRVLDLSGLNIELKNMAVLFRANHQKAKLELALKEAGIPYEVVGAKPLFEEDHIKHIFAWLQLAVNPNDTVSLDRVFCQQKGLTAELFGLIEQASEQQDEPFWDAADRFLATPQTHLSGGSALTALVELRSKIDVLRDHFQQDSSLPNLIKGLLDRHYLGYLQALHPADWEERMNDIQTLVDLSHHYSTIEELLTQITLEQIDVKDRSQSSSFADNDRLILSTIHSAKGLEWDAVFVIGLVEGVFPSYKAQDVEEERRMFHVALTRARRYLYLSYTSIQDTFNSQRTVKPSPFLTELPAHLYEFMELP